MTICHAQPLEWFLYVERNADQRKAIVAGPYATADDAIARKHAVYEACCDRVKDGHGLWFETWGHCSAPVGTLTAKLGII